MRSYEAARTLFNLLAFVAWIAVGVGVIAAIGGAAAASEVRSWGGGSNGMAVLMAALPGSGLTFFGFLGLAAVQIGRASVDTAEYTQQMLKIARDQLEVSQQALTRGSKTQESFAGLQVGAEAKTGAQASDGPSYGQKPSVTKKPPQLEHTIGSKIDYKNKTIHVVEAGYSYGGTAYPTLEAAKAKVDEGASYVSVTEAKPPYAEQLGVNPSSATETLKRS